MTIHSVTCSIHNVPGSFVFSRCDCGRGPEHRRAEVERKLTALSRRQGHEGLLEVRDVADMLLLRDERAASLESIIEGRRV